LIRAAAAVDQAVHTTKGRDDEGKIRSGSLYEPIPISSPSAAPCRSSGRTDRARLVETIAFEDRRGHLQLLVDRLTDPENSSDSPFPYSRWIHAGFNCLRQAPPPSFHPHVFSLYAKLRTTSRWPLKILAYLRQFAQSIGIAVQTQIAAAAWQDDIPRCGERAGKPM